jgi:hypothetical protein
VTLLTGAQGRASRANRAGGSLSRPSRACSATLGWDPEPDSARRAAGRPPIAAGVPVSTRTLLANLRADVGEASASGRDLPSSRVRRRARAGSRSCDEKAGVDTRFLLAANGGPRPSPDTQIGSTDPARANELGGEPFAKAQDSRANSAALGSRRGGPDTDGAVVDVARERTRAGARTARPTYRPRGARQGGLR